MRIFDSHTHLNDEAFTGHVAEYVAHAQKLGVTQMAIVGSDTNLNAGALQLAHQYDNLFAIVGWHPEESKRYHAAEEATLIEQLQDPKTVAVGEIGLDYHQNVAPHAAQKNVFKRQIELAKAFNLPISIHTRDAFEDTYRLLEEVGVPARGGVMHSFNGDPEWMQRFLEMGFYISFSGVVSFKNAHDVHATARAVPSDRMLVETDAPYLAPMPFRGKQNQPAYSLYTLEALARLRDENPDQVAEQTYQNTHRLLEIDHD
ncbi:mg-dependent dnase, tatd family protein [Lactobacillus selangorensis]|uniref:Mg-dependent dnase, tatd family protein n=1 Tax=Lactobacillus selangorensis TaxID=81857 RepID=A0A0R2FZG4_9LACO|nr:TatD family hydrolase [Lactobacillus selangorensis]KRN27911.1 mg-dependent dnase, tatd family protein [Lactobacillus selangorensis]KRN30618.1 mg-dependent dnase, tatd family protein [Lactobacillus selangorensis]